MVKILAAFMAVCILAMPLQEALAHDGDVDSGGCHFDTATGVYHCHRIGGQDETSQPVAEEEWARKVREMQADDSWCPPVMAHLLPHAVELLSQESKRQDEIRPWIVSLVAGIAMMDNSNHVKQAFLAMGCAFLIPALKQELSGKRTSKRPPKWVRDLLKDMPSLE